MLETSPVVYLEHTVCTPCLFVYVYYTC